MERRTICWVQHASEYPLFEALAKQLSQKNYDSFFVCKTKPIHEEYVKSGFKSYFATPDIFFGDSVSEEQYERIKVVYGSDILEKLCMSDVHVLMLYPYDQKSREAVVAKSILYWERIFSSQRVDYLIMRESAMFLTRAAYYVAEQKGIPCGRLMYGPGNGLCLLTDVGELDIWSELDSEVKKGPYEISQSQKILVDEFVLNRLPKSTKQMTMRFVPESIFSSLKQYVGLWWHDSYKAFKKDPIYIGAIRFVRYRKQKQLFWKYVTRHFFTYKEVNESDAIVYFPVYSGLETSYLVHVPQWSKNQTNLILKVARSLPEGYTLYVKEHPHNPGDLSFFQLRRLAKEPNIKIVRSQVSSQYLIERSKLTVVIEGTAGWEAFLSKRPVLCIEDVAFYGRSSLVSNVIDIRTLEARLAAVLSEGDTIYKKRENEWYWFIYSVITTAGKGNTINLVPPYGFVTNEEEVALVAAYLDQKINRVCVKADAKV